MKTDARDALSTDEHRLSDEERARRAAAWDSEHRDGMSYGDLQDLLSSAVSEKFRPADLAADDYWYAYVVDFDDDTVVFSAKGEKMRCTYSLDGTSVTLGDAEPVRAQTTYVPVEIKSDGSKNFATPRRAFSSLVEQAPARSVELQVRMEDDADSHAANFRGYAYTIDERYGVVDWLGEYEERIGPGASSKTLREQSSIPLLRNHDANYVLANTSSRTSQLSDDGTGLLNVASFDRRQTYTNDMCISLSRGDIDKMSFSFRAIQESWNDLYDDRYVTELRLYDTSIVTYPANPTTSAELVDAMRSAMGREGRSLWLADSELSMRSALPVVFERHELPEDGEDLIERALRALVHADEIASRSGQQGRARTFLVGQAMLELRAGKTLSAKNETLLKNALDALSAADKQHAKMAKAHSTASDAVTEALASAQQSSGDGTSTGTPPGSSNPINPSDGAGPRSAALKLRRQREAELRALRR